MFSEESEVSLNKSDNGSDFTPWKASQSPEPEPTTADSGSEIKRDDGKAELLRSTLKANIGNLLR